MLLSCGPPLSLEFGLLHPQTIAMPSEIRSWKRQEFRSGMPHRLCLGGVPSHETFSFENQSEANVWTKSSQQLTSTVAKQVNETGVGMLGTRPA